MAGEADLWTRPFDAAQGKLLAAADCAVVVTDHSWYDWAAIRQQARVVDTRHAVT